MYARIVNNEIAELDSGDHEGESGWKPVPADAFHTQKVYDTGTGLVRPQTASETAAIGNALLLEDAWQHLRGMRNRLLKRTDAYVSTSDRPATANMPEYRAYLRGLPATYDDTSILSQDAVMDFDTYVASL
jgi:hypothetical protein